MSYYYSGDGLLYKLVPKVVSINFYGLLFIWTDLKYGCPIRYVALIRKLSVGETNLGEKVLHVWASTLSGFTFDLV